MTKIPKIIHYCWVGGKPKPQSVLYCIESWKRCCPDYEIREWNETNYDFTKNEYMRQAYETQKWGFVPDYARLDIIYTHGGIYLDTDVEIVRSFDKLLENDCFFGFEDTGDGEYFVNCGHGFGAIPGHKAIRRVRDLYDHISFIQEDGSINLLPSPHYTTQALRQLGLIQQNKDQTLPQIQIFASDVLCPKNFRTGKLTKTSRTVSIHHFSASWVDEKIKQESHHQQRIFNKFGSRLGRYILIAESLFQKYSSPRQLVRLPLRLAKKLKSRFIRLIDATPWYLGLLKAKFQSPKKDGVVLLDTSMDSDNCGDYIIMENCLLHLHSHVDSSSVHHVPTHRLPDNKEFQQLRNSYRKLLCGTNILSGHMRHYGLWQITPDVTPWLGTILMGVGFDSTKKDFDQYSKLLLHTILHKNALHSVRDSFSEKKLRDMGISNVLNTGCPTMWNLTPDHCASIPQSKATNVVCTVTDYSRDPQNDKAMLDTLLQMYDKVYLWLQGRDDPDYLRELGYHDSVILIEPTLEAYDAVLSQQDLDYVGTRLHAGIRALSKGHRTLVVSIDNRAACISEDTGLPTIRREDIPFMLKEKLEKAFETRIALPWDNIRKWKQQFEELT